MERTKRDLILGLVFFAGLGLLVWSTFNLGKLSLRPAQQLSVRFPSAGGLREGDPVQVLGLRVGQVAEVNLAHGDPRYRIVVLMQLDEPIALRSDYRIEIRSANVLSGQMVEIDPGVGREPHRGEVYGATPGGPLEALGNTFSGENNRADLSGALRAIREVFESALNPKGTLGALLQERGLYDNIQGFAVIVQRLAESVERGEGALGRLLRDRELSDNLAQAVASARSIAEKVDRGPGFFSRLLNDAQLGSDMAQITADFAMMVRGVRDGKGIAGLLLADAEARESVRAILDGGKELMRKANDPEAGMVGALFGSTTLRATFARVVDNVGEMTERIRNGEGLLARLINDRELGEKLDRVFTQVSRALEDAREAAPIGTFIQVLGGIL